MRTTWKWGWVGGLALAMQVSVASAEAQTSALEGSYILVPEESADVRAAVRAGTEKANFFVRNFGRGVLERSLEPADTLRITFDEGGVSITTKDGDVLHTPLDGAPVEVRNSAGEMERVTTDRVDGSLRRLFDAGKGTREFFYALEQDGTALSVSVEVRSSMFPEPIRYRLLYARLSDGR